MASENAKNQQTPVDFRQGDLFEPIDGSYDMIVSNPPYIPTDEIQKLMAEVRFHDPIGALDGKEDGLYFYRKIVTKSRGFLKPGGWLMVEIGHDQGERVAELMRAASYKEIKIVKDLAGLDRVVTGRWNEEEKYV